jgi:transcriptional regulator with GAF, ATPase, and Fis domain
MVETWALNTYLLLDSSAETCAERGFFKAAEVAFQFFNSQSNNRDLRVLVATLTGLIVAYCVAVLWYVATFPDVGLRCLLPDSSPRQNGGIEIRQWVPEAQGSTDPRPKPGDQLVRLNGQEIETFLDFVSSLESLRFAKIPPGGQLAPGSDPAELKVPPLVEVYSGDPASPAQRLVEIVYRNSKSSQPLLENRIYVAVRPIEVQEVSITIFWFACQLSILAVALTSYWYRPFDLVSQNFCLMCCASMGAFVAGFHWWILAGNPLLNIPFILCATATPALVLNFFLVFPRESELIRTKRPLAQIAVVGPMAFSCFLLVVIYWSSWSLNGNASSGDLNVFQKFAVLTQIVFRGSASGLDLVNHSTELLYLMRITVYASIGLACVYFLLIVCKLAYGWFTIELPRERQQVNTILGAALLSTLPIGYTLYLAFFRKIDFALGRGQIPMFVASMLFMAAYSHGMFRHRLMLAEDPEDKGRRYILMSLLVSGGFATLLAIGGVVAHAYSLPLNSSTTQQISLFLILLLAAGITLWVRDRLQTVVDRTFFSEKYQLDRAMQQLNRSASYLSDPSGMAEMTLKTCQDVMDATSAMMFVRDGQGSFRLIGTKASSHAPAQLKPEQIPVFVSGETVIRRIPQTNLVAMDSAQRLLHDLKSELLCVMEGEGGLHGVIILGRRRSGSAYTAEDIAFLHAISQMSVLALHSSRANQTMARLDAELKMKMDRIAEQQRQMAVLRAELTSLQRDAGQAPVVASEQDFDTEGIRGSSSALLNVLSQVRKVARSSSTVLIRGESGTGKELLARVIHRNSDRSSENLVCVNCAALSSSLLESELFGHVKGAYTGAHADKAGRFLAADKGTLFLDEIGEISPETQVKLLRVLQERCFEAVGSDKTIQVDVRVIAATNRNLEEMISRGQFRADLFYRLNVVSLTLPPLRERPEDLAELVFFFLSRSAQKTKKQIRQIDPDALAAIEAHLWPGNIRELENVIERAVVLADSDMITMTDLPDEFQFEHQSKPRPARHSEISAAVIASTATVRSVSRNLGDGDSISTDSEEQILREALRVASGNKALAARRLNLPRSTFFSKCRKYGIG